MASNYESIYVKRFGDQITQLAQQRTNRISNIITKPGDIVGDIAFFNFLAASSMYEITEKNTDTRYDDLTFSRRGIGFKKYGWSTLNDRFDLKRIIGDPTSPETQNAAMAKVRQMDAVAYAAMWGDTYITTGNSTVLTPLSYVSGNIIESDAVLPGTPTNATYELINKGVAHLKAQEVDLEDPENQLYVVLNSSAEESLKDDDKVINRDYNDNKIVSSGRLSTPIAGCIPLYYEGLYKDGSNDVYGIVFARKGMGFMERDNFGIRIQEESTKNYATSIFMSTEFAALRLQDTHVVVVKFRQA